MRKVELEKCGGWEYPELGRRKGLGVGSIKMSLMPISFLRSFAFFFAFFAPACPPCSHTTPLFSIVIFEIRWLGIRIWDRGSGFSCALGEADEELRTTEKTGMTSNSVLPIPGSLLQFC
jgi:hypothetical protein